MNRKITRCIDQLNAHCGDCTTQCCRHSQTSVCTDIVHPSRSPAWSLKHHVSGVEGAWLGSRCIGEFGVLVAAFP